MQPVKYVAEVSPVKEVTLHGTADLAYWREKLAAENLQPLAADGLAQVFVSATEARFMGITFRESLIGIHVQPTSTMPEGMPAMFLIQAWNSLSAFAWIERTMFGTPYAAGKIAVEPKFPASLELSQRGERLITAAMSAESQQSTETAEENWHGAIFLPRRKGGKQTLFVAKLAGLTEHFSFRAGDTFELVGIGCGVCPSPQPFPRSAEERKRGDAVGSLLDSHFSPRAWHVRQAAAHAKSKTYRADQFFGG